MMSKSCKLLVLSILLNSSIMHPFHLTNRIIPSATKALMPIASKELVQANQAKQHFKEYANQAALKAITLVAAAAACDPIYAAGITAASVFTGAAAGLSKECLNAENSGFSKVPSYIKDPFLSIEERAYQEAQQRLQEQSPLKTEPVQKELLKRYLPFGAAAYVSLETLGQIYGPAFVSGFDCGASSLFLYLMQRIRHHKQQLAIEQQEPETLAQLAHEFNKAETALEQDTPEQLMLPKPTSQDQK